MDDPLGSIVETRQELMVSPTENYFRTAYFLKPTSPTSTDEAPPPPPPFLDIAKTETCRPRNSQLEVSFDGWLFPQENWKNWVDRLSLKHKKTWEKTGIYEAIMASTYKINKYPDLVLELSKEWCPETNSFVFNFAETTITLEDILLCGGYSVLGCPVFSENETFLNVEECEETLRKEAKLEEERLVFVRSKAKKATQFAWMKRFWEKESEIEHEAFLSLWLSRFVFPSCPRTVVLKNIFPVAIRLARGTRIALAPAVLASIYRDLSLLKRKMVSFDGSSGSTSSNSEEVAVWAPFQLVLVWIWERFSLLQPERNLVEMGEISEKKPRLAQWHKVNKLECDQDIKSVLDSSGEFFTWRPYAIATESCALRKFYGEKDWLLFDKDLDDEFMSFARCLRASELVGVDQFGHFVEQYLPHRVARQFGFDQDLPGSVIRCNQSRAIAWRCYNRPLGCGKLYFPSRFFPAGVSSRYFEWWNRSKLGGENGVSPVRVEPSTKQRKEIDTSVHPGFPRKCNGVGEEIFRSPGNGTPLSAVKKKQHGIESVKQKAFSKCKRKRPREEKVSARRPVFPQKFKKAKVAGCDPEGRVTLAEICRSQDIDGKIPVNGSPSNVVKEEEDLTEPVVEMASMEDQRKILRAENDLSCPPGFYRKYGNKVEARGSTPDIDRSVNGDHLPKTEPFQKEASMEDKRKRSTEENGFLSRPPCFYKKDNKVEVGRADSDDELTLTQMFRSQNTNGSANRSPLPMMEPAKEEAAMEDRKKSEVVSEEERSNCNEGKSREVCRSGLDEADALEARIAKLEKLIAEIKSTRRGNILSGNEKEPIQLD